MRYWRKVLGALIFVAVFAVLAGALVNARSIEDWLRLRNYKPPAPIASIAKEDKLTDHARHILYVTHPILDTNPADFIKRCPQSEQTIVLGCYHSGVSAFTDDSFLYVKSVNDPRLNGVEEVTTAHEMLHAAYDRLSSDQKQSVDKMLMDYYQHGLTDKRIQDTINSYKKTEPDDLVNEMHSIFGTEVPSLPAPLENYYKQYFSDRSAVVSFAQNYEGEFTNRITKIKADDIELTVERDKILNLENELRAELQAIEADRSGVEHSNDQTAIDQYNTRVTAYNSGVRQLRNEIAAYNQLVDERNQIAQELRSLQDSLSSQLTPQ